jgi:hypothetical protein
MVFWTNRAKGVVRGKDGKTASRDFAAQSTLLVYTTLILPANLLLVGVLASQKGDCYV